MTTIQLLNKPYSKQDVYEYAVSARKIIVDARKAWKEHPSQDETIDEIFLELISAQTQINRIIQASESREHDPHP